MALVVGGVELDGVVDDEQQVVSECLHRSVCPRRKLARYGAEVHRFLDDIEVSRNLQLDRVNRILKPEVGWQLLKALHLLQAISMHLLAHDNSAVDCLCAGAGSGAEGSGRRSQLTES